jgi:Mg2+-importing ATPase
MVVLTKSTKEAPITHKDYLSIGSDEVFNALGTTKNGLTEDEAEIRLRKYGPNRLPREGIKVERIILRQFDPLILILLATVIISIFIGSAQQAYIIMIIIALSVSFSFYNEYRAGKLVEELEKKVSIKATVTRDSKTKEIDSAQIVPGDLVSVYIGDIVPADVRLVEVKDLEVDEATLTGESFPATKSVEAVSIQEPVAHQATNCLFMGTTIVRGSGKGVVTQTGKNTEFGAISKSIARPHPLTEFQRGIKSYGNMLIILTSILSVSVFALNALLGHDLLNSLLFSVAIAIGLVPELMPAIVTVALSHGAHMMAKSDVIVKRLVSMEDFGNMDVLCTDKTGTLTEGKIALEDYFSLDKDHEERTLIYSLLCNSAIVGDTVTGNPMDTAIWNYARERGLADGVKAFAKVDDVPFDYQRRRISAVVKHGEELLFLTKGAPESVVPECTFYDQEGKAAGINDDVLAMADKKFYELSESGYRILAIAYKTIEAKPSYSTSDEVALTLLGFLVFNDPPKPSATAALKRLKELGVDTKVLTGDNALVAKKVYEELDIPVTKVLDGPDLLKLSWADLKKAVEEANIFARVTPEQKLDIIKALKENKHIVGYMGDGVNDAPALYEADASISVDSAADVSKEAADIVLLQKDLMVLAGGIDEGRKTFGNTIKYVLMGTSSNFGNMFSAAAASLFLPFLPMLPMQILFMNLLYNVANLTLPTDNVDAEDARLPRHWDIPLVQGFTLFFGPFSSVYDFLTFGIMLFIFNASTPAHAALFQTGWFVESFLTEVLIIFVIRTRRFPFFSSRPGKWLTILTIGCCAFGIVLPFTFLGGFLGFTSLPANFWPLVALMVATYLLLVDAGKVFFYKVCGF